MKPTTIYMIAHHEEESPSGWTHEWHTTFNKAMKRLRELKLSDSLEIRVIDVPRTKIGLVEWLNTHAGIG